MSNDSDRPMTPANGDNPDSDVTETRMSRIDVDMRTAGDERFARLVELHRRRREADDRRKADHLERRRHGVAARHRAKLARAQEDEEE